MTPLQIGQSLTWSQVRDLPDGAFVDFEDSAGQICHWFAKDQASRDKLCAILEYSMRTSATLVSLPTTEPQPESSPGDGYRWVAPDERIQSRDEEKSRLGWYPVVGMYSYPTAERTYRRRIEPKETYREPLMVQCDLCKLVYPSGATHDCYQLAGSEPTPRVASEIEKRAALALAEMSVLDLRDVSQANGVEIMWTDVADACRDYLRAHDYARSIGAIEWK